MSQARVYLIGAGPGDEGLLTIKAQELLSQAEVVVYDYLAHESLLAYAPREAKRIYVGKKGFEEHITQEEIHTILIEEARRDGGKIVVRLKGGDPFVFGRGGEEALALVQAEIPFEVVPGISSGIAAPAYAGIPVTHRYCASSVAFVTGHEDPGKNSSSIQWEYLAQGVDTLCFYMGIKNIKLIADKLMKYGRPGDEPVALIRWGTTARQELLISSLAQVVEDQKRYNIQAPAIIVVGKVVKLHEQLQWFDPQARIFQLPLQGKKIVITRSRSQNSSLAAALKSRGAQVIEFPTIKILPAPQPEALRAAVQRSVKACYDWLVVSSNNGVEAFFRELHALKLDSRALGSLRFAVVGQATADSLRRYGIYADLIPETYHAEALCTSLATHAELSACSKVLIIRGDKARRTIAEGLRARGVLVDEVDAYQTVLEDSSSASALYEQLCASAVDGICFSSSSTVHNFIELMSTYEAQLANTPQVSGISEKLRQLLDVVNIFSIGEITSQSIASYGLSVAAQAKLAGVEELADAVSQYFCHQKEEL